jgi:hypothetical protein
MWDVQSNGTSVIVQCCGVVSDETCCAVVMWGSVFQICWEWTGEMCRAMVSQWWWGEWWNVQCCGDVRECVLDLLRYLIVQSNGKSVVMQWWGEWWTVHCCGVVSDEMCSGDVRECVLDLLRYLIVNSWDVQCSGKWMVRCAVVMWELVQWWVIQCNSRDDILMQTVDRRLRRLSTSPVHPDGSPVLAQVNQPTNYVFCKNYDKSSQNTQMYSVFLYYCVWLLLS